MVLALARKAIGSAARHMRRLSRTRKLLAGAALASLLAGAGFVSAEEAEVGILPHIHLRPTPNCPNPPCAPAPAVPSTPPVTPMVPDPAKKETIRESVIDPALAPVTTAALGDSMVSLRNDAGYIDNAMPLTHFRLRYDNANFSNRPDRAEFFYPKCGCFRVAGIDPKASGPALSETTVDYQDVSAYVEVAANSVFSAFIDIPVRFLNPDRNANTAGLADINAGFKAAFYRTESSIATFQLRAYIPTGDGDRGLGTNHVSLEPSLLFAKNFGDGLLVFGQVGDWISIGGSDFAGNVLRYGVGASYLLIERGNWRMAPVAEVLGWTVLSGLQSDFPGNITDASGDTIVNGKFGLRFGFGPLENQAGLLGNSDLYIGYGRALTGDVWYKDIWRVEYRIRF